MLLKRRGLGNRGGPADSWQCLESFRKWRCPKSTFPFKNIFSDQKKYGSPFTKAVPIRRESHPFSKIMVSVLELGLLYPKMDQTRRFTWENEVFMFQTMRSTKTSIPNLNQKVYPFSKSPLGFSHQQEGLYDLL